MNELNRIWLKTGWICWHCLPLGGYDPCIIYTRFHTKRKSCWSKKTERFKDEKWLETVSCPAREW